MKHKPLTDNLAELNDIIKRYIKARIRLLQVILLDKLSKAGTLIITSIIVIMAIAFIILLLTLAFSFWYGEQYGSLMEGFLISAAFYVVITLLIYWLRKPIITNIIIRGLVEMFDNNDDDDDDENKSK